MNIFIFIITVLAKSKIKKNITSHSILIHLFYGWRLEELKNMTHHL